MKTLAAAAVALLLLFASCGDDGTPPRATSAAASEGTATAPAGYRHDPALAGGVIEVVVRTATPAETRPVAFPAGYAARSPEDAAFCEGCASRAALTDESLVTGQDGGVLDVVVSLKTIAAGARPPLAPATLDNACCRFAPHVALAPVGAPLRIANSDPVTHTVVLTTLAGLQVAMMTIPAKAATETTAVDAPGILAATCPIHPWMRGFVVALRHPYATLTDPRGAARLDRVPPGAHELVLWHPRLGRATRAVTVRADEPVRVAFDDAAFRN